MKFIPLLLIIAYCVSSCGFVTDEQVVGKYHIIAVDVAEDACLAYETGKGNYVSLVPSEVFAYSNNERYIFVKQNIDWKRETSSVRFYIVPIVADTVTIYPEERIIGPLKEKEFYTKISRLGVKDLDFKDVN